MITSKLQGGMANQMFEIAAAYSLALSNNDKCSFNFDDCYTPAQGNPSNKYKDNLFKNLSEIKNYNNFTSQYNEPKFSYNKIEYVNNLLLNGYFQSEKYFKEHKKEIQNLFYINPNDICFIKNKYKNIDFNKTVSVQIRRGDYLRSNGYHNVLDIEYYKKAMKYFDDSYYFIFVSDDIKWCKENFKADNYIFCEFESDILQFTLLTITQHSIIANSTFSWWGTYLNKNENKKVIAPSKWFGDNSSAPKDTQDIYCENWIKI